MQISSTFSTSYGYSLTSLTVKFYFITNCALRVHRRPGHIVGYISCGRTFLGDFGRQQEDEFFHNQQSSL